MTWPFGWTILPALNPGSDSYARAISADGTTIVGQSGDPDDNLIATYWTEDGIVGLGTLPNLDGLINSDSEAVSDDGSVIVGWCHTISDDTNYAIYHAFQWTAAGGMQDLTPFYTYLDRSQSISVTADGVTAAGDVRVSLFPDEVYRVFVWTQADGLTLIPIPSGMTTTIEGVISPNGQHLIGGNFAQYFTWTPSGGSVLGPATPLFESGDSSYPFMNNDGVAWVTGHDSDNTHAKLWKITDAIETTDLGLLPGGTYAGGHAVMGDGSIVVGEADNADGVAVAFRWTSATGMIEIAPPDGYHSPQPAYSKGISADGQIFTGYVTDVDNIDYAFVYRVPPPRQLQLVSLYPVSLPDNQFAFVSYDNGDFPNNFAQLSLSVWCCKSVNISNAGLQMALSPSAISIVAKDSDEHVLFSGSWSNPGTPKDEYQVLFSLDTIAQTYTLYVSNQLWTVNSVSFPNSGEVFNS